MKPLTTITLATLLKSHSYFDYRVKEREAITSGSIVQIKQRHQTTLRELWAAIKILVKYPQTYRIPLDWLKRPDTFRDGRCNLYPPTKREQKKKDTTAERYQVPHYQDALGWYQRLSIGRQTKIDAGIRQQLAKLRIVCENPLAHPVGQACLVTYWQHCNDSLQQRVYAATHYAYLAIPAGNSPEPEQVF